MWWQPMREKYERQVKEKDEARKSSSLQICSSTKRERGGCEEEADSVEFLRFLYICWVIDGVMVLWLKRNFTSGSSLHSPYRHWKPGGFTHWSAVILWMGSRGIPKGHEKPTLEGLTARGNSLLLFQHWISQFFWHWLAPSEQLK